MEAAAPFWPAAEMTAASEAASKRLAFELAPLGETAAAGVVELSAGDQLDSFGRFVCCVLCFLLLPLFLAWCRAGETTWRLDDFSTLIAAALAVLASSDSALTWLRWAALLATAATAAAINANC